MGNIRRPLQLFEHTSLLNMSHNVFVLSFWGKEKRGEAQKGGGAGEDGVEAEACQTMM